MTDMEILASVQNDGRFGSEPGLSDVIDDIGGVFSDTWDSIVGNTKKEVGNTIEKGVKKVFGNEDPGEQVPYDVMSQPQQETTPTEKTFIQKVPPVVVGAGTTVLVKYVGKFGWITSITAGVAAGAAKHFLIDKKQGA